MLKVFSKRLQEFFCSPEKVFTFAVVISIVCSAVYVIFFLDIYRDTAGVYAMCARALAQGDWNEGVSDSVPMLNILLGGFLSWLGLDTIMALVIVSCAFFVAGCFPLRNLLLRYVTPLQAAYGCLLYVSAPKIIRFCCSGLLESGRIFFMLSAVLYFLRMVEKPNVKNASFFGISAGLLMVARGEGLPAGLMLLAAVMPFAALFYRPQKWKKLVLANLLAIVAALIFISPFCAINYQRCGYFVTDMRAVSFVRTVQKVFAPEVTITADGEKVEKSTPLFMSAHKGNRSWGEKTSTLFKHIPRGGYELYMIFAAIGLVVAICKRQLKSDYLLFAALTIIHIMAFFLIVSAYRYYLFLIPLFMMFTVSGLTWVYEKIVQYLPRNFMPVIYIACAAVMVLQVINGLERAFSREDEHYRQYGKWLVEYGKTHYPGRRMRLIAISLPETAYWSGAYVINAYGHKHEDLRTIKDFDLMIVRKDNLSLAESRNDLELLPDALASDKIAVFRLKAHAAEERK